VVLPLSILCGELCLLVLWCAGDRCDMVDSDEDRGRSRRPGVEDRGWSSTGRVLGGWTIKRLGDAVCSLHCAQGDEEHEFLGLDLKTGSYGLVIWASKSPWRFLGLGLETKWATICRLRHKTDGRMKTVLDTCRDLAACFAWKQVELGFPSLASRLTEA
jgi:hypothetical protein